MKVHISAKLWLYPGETANWHFLTVPKKESSKIDEQHKQSKKGWGSLPVTAVIAKTTWDTSIFPDKKSGTYLLPVKTSVRKATGIQEGDTVVCTIRIRV